MCRPAFRPIDEIIVEEFEATSRWSIRAFQTLSAGKTEQSEIPGRVGTAPGGGGTGWLAASSGLVP